MKSNAGFEENKASAKQITNILVKQTGGKIFEE
jgi:hypothetical protein